MTKKRDEPDEERARRAAIAEAAAAVRAGVTVTWRDWKKMTPLERAARITVLGELAGAKEKVASPSRSQEDLVRSASSILEEDRHGA